MEPVELSVNEILLRVENGVLEATYARWELASRTGRSIEP